MKFSGVFKGDLNLRSPFRANFLPPRGQVPTPSRRNGWIEASVIDPVGSLIVWRDLFKRTSGADKQDLLEDLDDEVGYEANDAVVRMLGEGVDPREVARMLIAEYAESPRAMFLCARISHSVGDLTVALWAIARSYSCRYPGGTRQDAFTKIERALNEAKMLEIATGSGAENEGGSQ